MISIKDRENVEVEGWNHDFISDGSKLQYHRHVGMEMPIRFIYLFQRIVPLIEALIEFGCFSFEAWAINPEEMLFFTE